MSKKIIHIMSDEFGQLICDTPQCGHVESAQPFTKDLIDKACPECGSNLLNKADYKAAKRLLRKIGILNFLFGWLGTEEPPEGTPTNTVNVKVEGGKTKISLTDE